MKIIILTDKPQLRDVTITAHSSFSTEMEMSNKIVLCRGRIKGSLCPIPRGPLTSLHELQEPRLVTESPVT